ncbi:MULTISPECIES: usg protein [unclassified Xanthobacter]|uniref:usg protein n=1 Tax=unclassified Xanthobacter TaxID=2623496 RepID=UPI001EE0F7D1|nr:MULTISPECIES: usg protein [unclassified Xanthobacter]
MASQVASRLEQGGVSEDFRLQLEGYGLATAEILYRMPDHPVLLQTFLWQDYDLCPKFPELNRFLEFWQREIEGPLHSVRVVHCGLIKPAELRAVDGLFVLH